MDVEWLARAKWCALWLRKEVSGDEKFLEDLMAEFESVYSKIFPDPPSPPGTD